MRINKILTPTDFSGCSINALKVAARLANEWGAKLIITNACQKPVAYSDTSVLSHSRNLIKEAEANANMAFERVLESVTELEGVDYHFEVKHAFPQDAIISQVLMEEIDLVVMGTTGASGFRGILMGSNTYTVAKNVKCPVLAIPEKAATTSTFRKIVLAKDYNSTASKDTFAVLIELARIFNAEIHVLHVSEKMTIDPKEAEEAKKLDTYLKGLKHSFHFELDDHIDEGINKYIEEHSIELLTLVAKKHHLLDKIFKGSMTRKMAYHSKVPFLILHPK